MPDRSVEMIAAGRAFHWFDPDRALAEFRRILKPRGWVTLVSLARSNADTPQRADLEHLLMEYGTDQAYVRSTQRVHEGLHQRFAEFHQAQLPGEHRLDWTSFHGWIQSLSAVPQPGTPRYLLLQAKLQQYFATHANDGILSIPTICWISAAR